MTQISYDTTRIMNHSLVIGMASISLFADTSQRVMNDITKQMVASIDQTLLLLSNKNTLFAVDEIPELQRANSLSQIEEEENIALQNQFDKNKKKPSLLAQKLSLLKVDKQADLRKEQELDEFIQRSTLEDICGEGFIIDANIENQAEIFDDLEVTNNKSQRKSIVFSVKKVPNFFQEVSQSFQSLDDQLDELRIDFDKIKVGNTKVSSKWSDNSSVQYHMTDYNTNESSNLDNYSYKWQESSSKQQLFNINSKMFEGGVFDFQGSFNNESMGYQSVPQEHDSPKKKQQRLYCNTKKVPHWAENVSVIQSQLHKQTPQVFRGVQAGAIEHDNIFPDLLYNPQRGSSAQWKHVVKTSQYASGHLVAMEELMKSFHTEGLVINHQHKNGVKQKLIGLIKSVKKIFNSSENV